MNREDETDWDEIEANRRMIEEERQAELEAADDADGYDPAEPWMDRD